MDFGFTPEQDELRTTVRTLLDRHGLDRHGGSGAPLWTRLAGELGVTALVIAEEHGGFGASLVEVGIVLEETGRALTPAPYLSTVVAAAAVDPALAAGLLPGIADGSTVATLAVAEPGVGWDLDRLSCTAGPSSNGHYLLDGVKEHVLDGQLADLAVVAARCDGEIGLFAVRADDAKRTPYSTLDLSRGQAALELTAAPAVRVGGPGAAARAVDLLCAALAVESVGVARASLDRIVEHLKTREQFGAPLATFQALRHRVADLFVAVEAATSSAWYALRAAGTAEFPVVAPLAKLVATRAAYAVTAESIQLHGGIGFTWEHDAHRYFKRATANQLVLGDPGLRRLIASRAPVPLPLSRGRTYGAPY